MTFSDDTPCTLPNCATCDLVQWPDETLVQWLARIRALAAPVVFDPIMCRNGHPRTPESTYITPAGDTMCRPCRTVQRAQHHQRKRRGRAGAA